MIAGKYVGPIFGQNLVNEWVHFHVLSGTSLPSTQVSSYHHPLPRVDSSSDLHRSAILHQQWVTTQVQISAVIAAFADDLGQHVGQARVEPMGVV